MSQQKIHDPNLSKEKAIKIMSEMTLEEKIGQLLFIRLPLDNSIEIIRKYHPGGCILFANNFENKTKEQIKQEIQQLQKASKTPLFFGVDEEGGTVVRISRFPQFRSTPYLSPQNLFANGGFNLIEQDTIDKCQFLHDLGINVNFAPVCDVSEDPKDFIYSRSFGQNAQKTAEYIKTVVKIMKEKKIGSVLKHFPGYGNNIDTHFEVAFDERPFDTFTSSDFIPFQAGIDSGADIVMFSHNVMSCIDKSLPSSLSLPVHKILREKLNFSGLTITDDFDMQGIVKYADKADIASLAIQAGNDLLCCRKVDEIIPDILKAVKEGKITKERINESILRIIQKKISLGLIE